MHVYVALFRKKSHRVSTERVDVIGVLFLRRKERKER